MAKKKTARSGKGGHPAGNATVPLNAYRARRAMGAMQPAFGAWFGGSYGTLEEAAACLEAATGVAAAYLEITGRTEVTAFEPEPLVTLVDELEAEDPEAALTVVSAFHLYVDFLMETEAWTGSEEDLAECHEILVELEDEDEAEQPVLEVPEIPGAEEGAYLATVPLVSQAVALLEWLGDGRPVTGTRALRLKDIEAAAACVGETARGRGAVPTGEADVLARGVAHGAGTPVVVGSMHELPMLGSFWQGLEYAGLISVSATRAVPAMEFDPRGDDPVMLAKWRAFIGIYLWETVFGSMAARMWPGLFIVHAAVLAAACTDDPLATERVMEMAHENPGADLLQASDGFVPDLEPDFQGPIAELRARVFVEAFDRLAELGVVEADDHVRVPRPLIRSVAEALQEGFDFGLEYEGNPPNQTAAVGTMREDASGVPTYQLKIQLKGSKPPIWRRLEVASSLRLDQLHDVIQASFNWLDGHLHEFMVGGWRGQSYGPLDAEMAADGGMDEAAVRLSDILRAAGEKVDYVYDFGDNWGHSIALEEILPADPDGVGMLPRCTGGRCAAPMEDSGGVWGWEEKVVAANDSDHPDHQEIREWFGLPDGELLDPKAFDREEVNENLRDLVAGW